MAIVLIYDKLVRPDTTGVYCEAALRSLGIDVVHYAPLARAANGALLFRQWAELPKGNLYVQIDDDIAYPAPQVAAPRAYWCIDVHRMETMAEAL